MFWFIRPKKMKTPSWLDHSAILRFVFARCKENGGFAMTPLLPATVEDTYYAVKILRFLDKPLPSKTITYIAGLSWDKYFLPKNLYQLAVLHQEIGKELPKERLRLLIHVFLQRKALSLEHLTFLIRLSSLLSFEELKAKLCQKVCFTKWRVLKELFYLMHCAKECKTLLPKKAAFWVKSCQNDDGGFGFMPNTTSFLENIYYALAVLDWCNDQPLRPEGCLAFIRYCYLPNKGAFARSPSSVAFLESTYYALACVKITEKWHP